MPIQPKDIDPSRLKKTGPDVFSKDQQSAEQLIPAETKPVNVDYGEQGDGHMAGKDIDREEYEANGLPRTTGYTVQKNPADVKDPGKAKRPADLH